MTSTTKLTVENLINISPFTIDEAVEMFGVKKNTVHHFLRYGLRNLMFQSRREKLTTSVGASVKVYYYVDNVICPHCDKKIPIMDLEDLYEDNSSQK